MLECYTKKTSRAKKQHTCLLCGRAIEIGEKYIIYKGKTSYGWFYDKYHTVCQKIIDEFLDDQDENEYEQIKAEILARRNEWANKNDDYETASFIAYDTCLNMLDQLEPSWHPYPREEPPKGGELYWVTLDEGDGQRKVLDDLFLNGEFVNYNECSIVAWAEYNRPNPYEGEAYEH